VRKVPLRKSCNFNKLKLRDQGFLWIISRLLVENAIFHLPLDLLQQTALPLLGVFGPNRQFSALRTAPVLRRSSTTTNQTLTSLNREASVLYDPVHRPTCATSAVYERSLHGQLSASCLPWPRSRSTMRDSGVCLNGTLSPGTRLRLPTFSTAFPSRTASCVSKPTTFAGAA
jgi:hypothetical protein